MNCDFSPARNDWAAAFVEEFDIELISKRITMGFVMVDRSDNDMRSIRLD